MTEISNRFKLYLTISGTGAMEAAIAEAYQLKVIRVKFDLGEAADVKKVMEYVTPNTNIIM